MKMLLGRRDVMAGMAGTLVTPALAQARFSAGIIAGSRVSEARIPALKEHLAGLMLQGEYIDTTLQLTSALGGGYHHG